MYNKSRVYPQSKPIEYSAGFGKKQLPRTPWLGEPEVVEDPFARQRREREAKMREKYPGLEHMPYVIEDPEANQRYADYTKRRGGKDPMGFAAEEAKRRFQPAVQPIQYKQPFPVRDEPFPDQAEREPKKWVDTSSRSGGVEAWKKAGMPGYDPNAAQLAVTGTAKDGTEFGYKAQADAYDKWQAGDQGPEQGSPREKRPMVRNPEELYAEEWANRNQPFNAPSMAPGDASGKMPAYPGSTLKSPDGKVFNGDMMIDDGNYKPSGPIDKPKREKWIDTPQTQSDPTDQYRQQPVRETSDFNNPDLKKKDFNFEGPYDDQMMGPEGSDERYVYHQQALQNAGSPEEYQAHWQAMQKIGKPSGKNLRQATENYRPMTSGSYGSQSGYRP